jgi:hypothetical protein
MHWRYYRQIPALLSDIHTIRLNAEAFNLERTEIYNNAGRLESCLYQAVASSMRPEEIAAIETRFPFLGLEASLCSISREDAHAVRTYIR